MSGLTHPDTRSRPEAPGPSIYERITIEEAKARLRSEIEPPWDDIDEKIRRIVRILYEEGVETTESCQGGPGHAFPEPTVRFDGELAAGWKALSVALARDLRPTSLRRHYYIWNKEPVGPEWEMTFKLPDCPDWKSGYDSSR